MNPLTAPLAKQHIDDMHRAADRARKARDLRPHWRRTRRAR